MLFSNADDYKRCTEVVRKELSKRNVNVSDGVQREEIIHMI